MRAYEIFENTTSGVIATIVQPLGAIVKRNNLVQQSGKYKNSVELDYAITKREKKPKS